MFFLIPGKWLGEGNISITGSEENIHYYTKWLVRSEEDGIVHAIQVVEKEGIKEHVRNHYRFSRISQESFTVEMENNLFGITSGAGEITPEGLRWMFPDGSPCQGFEELQKIGDDLYQVHAEFVSESFKTLITGKLWKSN